MPKNDRKQVPLVMYRAGQRVEIGKAVVYRDGKIEAQISSDASADMKKILFADIGAVSIDPKWTAPPKIEYDKPPSQETLGQEN